MSVVLNTTVISRKYHRLIRGVRESENNFRILIAERKLNIADVYEDTGIAKTTLYGLYKETTKNPDI